MKIDGETLYKWWEETWPKNVRWGWFGVTKEGKAAWNALAERIKAEMGRPPIVAEGTFTEEDIEELFKPGAVIQQKMSVQRIPGTLREKVYGASKEWWLTQLGFANPADDAETEKIKQLSKATYEDAVKNTLGFDPGYSERILEQAIEAGKMPGQTKVAKATTNEYSTHHKSCALRHDGIACTCP